MKIKIDGKEITVTSPEKNIVEVAHENGITITAPCFRNKRKQGCCKACVVEINGSKQYACGTKPEDGMEIIYHRKDLESIRKERLEKYAEGVKQKHNSNECCGSSNGSCGCSGSSCCQ